MRTLRQLCLIATLIFTFAFSAYAGEIECPGITSDAPQATVTTEGDMNFPVTEIIVTLIESALSLT